MPTVTLLSEASVGERHASKEGRRLPQSYLQFRDSAAGTGITDLFTLRATSCARRFRHPKLDRGSLRKPSIHIQVRFLYEIRLLTAVASLDWESVNGTRGIQTFHVRAILGNLWSCGFDRGRLPAAYAWRLGAHAGMNEQASGEMASSDGAVLPGKRTATAHLLCIF